MHVALLFLLASGSWAADATRPHEHTGIVQAYSGAPPALALSDDELGRLAKDELVLKQLRVGNGGRGVAVMDIHATPQVIWSRILNYGMYPRWVDNVEACEVYKKEGPYIFTRFVLDPMGMTVEYFIKHTYDAKGGWLTWTLDYSRQSDLDDSVGYWRVTPLTADPPRSRLEYSVDIRFKGWIPQFAQDMIAKSGLTNAAAWVKKQSEG